MYINKLYCFLLKLLRTQVNLFCKKSFFVAKWTQLSLSFYIVCSKNIVAPLSLYINKIAPRSRSYSWVKQEICKYGNHGSTNCVHFLECGGSNQENRIVGGMPAGTNRYPWMARLVYDGQFHCGASLLTKEYVLTAAHCVRKWVYLFNFVILQSITTMNIVDILRLKEWLEFNLIYLNNFLQ